MFGKTNVPFEKTHVCLQNCVTKHNSQMTNSMIQKTSSEKTNVKTQIPSLKRHISLIKDTFAFEEKTNVCYFTEKTHCKRNIAFAF